jgi:hypothetical protein
VQCYGTEDAVRIVNSFHLKSHTCNYNHTIISYAVSHLHSLQSYTPIFHSLIVFITHIHTSNKHSVHTLRNCFLPRTYCLTLILKTQLNLLTASLIYPETTKRKTEPVNSVASGHVMSCCLATGSQGVLLCCHRVYNGVALETSVVSCDVIAACCVAMHGAVRLGTARRKHSFPYCCVTCLQTSVSLQLLHGVNTSQYIYTCECCFTVICIKLSHLTILQF